MFVVFFIRPLIKIPNQVSSYVYNITIHSEVHGKPMKVFSLCPTSFPGKDAERLKSKLDKQIICYMSSSILLEAEAHKYTSTKRLYNTITSHVVIL